MAASCAVDDNLKEKESEGNRNLNRDLNVNIAVKTFDTKAFIKSNWVNGDQILIWYDSNTGDTQDLTIQFDGSGWSKVGDANIPAQSSGTLKAVYDGYVKVSTAASYTYADNTITSNLKDWTFLTEIQVVVFNGINSANAALYTLACDKLTPCTGYTVGASSITAATGTKGDAVTGIANADGAAFVFATTDSYGSAADYKFTLVDNTSSSAVTKEYTANNLNITTSSQIIAKKIDCTKFAEVVPQEIEIYFDKSGNQYSTPQQFTVGANETASDFKFALPVINWDAGGYIEFQMTTDFQEGLKLTIGEQNPSPSGGGACLDFYAGGQNIYAEFNLTVQQHYRM